MRTISYRECLGLDKVDRNYYAFKDTYPYMDFGGKIDPLSELRNSGLFTNGSVFWVKSGSDADFTTFKDQVGAANLFTDIQSAINKCRNDRNDYVVVVPSDSNAVFTNSTAGTAILLNKNRVHLIAAGYGRQTHGYAVTVQGYGTSAAYDTAVVKVSGANCEIAGFKFLGTAGTTANGTISSGIVWLGTSSAGTAHETWMHDCIIENTQASGGGAGGTADCLQFGIGVNGCRFDNVTFASNTTGAKSINMGANGARTEFHYCRFLTAAQATADSFISTGTGANDYTLIANSKFVNVTSNKPASAITGSVTANTHWVCVDYPTGFNLTAFGTDPGCLVTGVQSGTAAAGMKNIGIGIQGTAQVPAA